MKQFFSDNGGILTVIAAAVVILGLYAEWRIATNVEDVLAAENLASASAVANLKESLEDDIADIEEDIGKIDGKVDQVITILLEDN